LESAHNYSTRVRSQFIIAIGSSGYNRDVIFGYLTIQNLKYMRFRNVGSDRNAQVRSIALSWLGDDAGNYDLGHNIAR
jgi:hypothetical protein